MIAVLSATEHDFYAMPLPFAVYSWAKVGYSCIVFIPDGNNPKIELAKKYCRRGTTFYEFRTAKDRIPTFSQVSRLFGAATEIAQLQTNTVMVTADSDICVFGDTFYGFDDGKIHILGADLTPDEQYPMCYAAMPVYLWAKVFGITKGYQEHIADIVNPIESDNVRGTNWCLDQFLLKKHIDASGEEIVKHNRSNGLNQFATMRADRDGWYFNPDNIIDAHLPRPLTDEDNFNKVYDLFKYKYPNDDLQWMIDYRNEYLKL